MNQKTRHPNSLGYEIPHADGDCVVTLRALEKTAVLKGRLGELFLI